MPEVEFWQGLQPRAVDCHDFIGKGMIKRMATVIVAPISIKKGREVAIITVWACSRGPFCHDTERRHSAPERRKTIEGKVALSKKYFTPEIEGPEEE